MQPHIGVAFTSSPIPVLLRGNVFGRSLLGGSSSMLPVKPTHLGVPLTQDPRRRATWLREFSYAWQKCYQTLSYLSYLVCSLACYLKSIACSCPSYSMHSAFANFTSSVAYNRRSFGLVGCLWISYAVRASE